MHRLIFFLVFLIQNITGFAQTLTKPALDEIKNAPKWAQLLYADHPNYYEVEKEYQQYYKQHEWTKDNHVRYYRFWKKLFLDHINDDGFIEYKAPIEKQSNRNSAVCYGDWSVVGPTQVYDINGDPSSDQSNVYCIAEAKSDSNILYCGTESGEVYKSIDHGNTWNNVSLTLDFQGHFHNLGIRAIAIHPTNPNIVYFSASRFIVKSVDGGLTWNYVYSHASNWWNFNAEKIIIHPQLPNKIFVATKIGLLSSNNAGLNWTTLFSQPTYDVCFKPSFPNTIYALRKNETTNVHEFIKSTNTGTSFQVMMSGWYNSTDPNRETSGGRIAVSANDPNRVYAYLIGQSKTGDSGFIGLYKSVNSGVSWTLPNGPIGGPYTMNHPNLANANILGTGHHQGLYNCALLASNTNANHILIGGNNLWQSLDGGNTFQPLGGYANGPLNNAIHVGSFHVDMQDFHQTGNSTWVTTDGGIYQSDDFFSSTNFVKKDFGIHSMEFWGLGQGWNQDVLYAGAYHNGNISFFENWGQGNSLSLGGGEPATGYVNPGDNRYVYSSEINTRILPLEIGDPIEERLFGIDPNESYWLLDEFSELEFDPRTFHIAYTGKDHQLWKTTDKGESFDLVHSFGSSSENKITFIEISRSHPDIMFVSQQHSTSQSSSVHKTMDAGLTWTAINLPSSSQFSKRIALQVDPYNPDNIWVGFNYSGNSCRIFNSNNGGVTWMEHTTPTIANKILNTLTFIPATDNGIYIGTHGHVYYKNDNMTDWVCFGNNLPPVTITFHTKPFYRDGKLRIATIKGIWESPLHDQPARPYAQISVQQLSSSNSVCLSDTFHFVDHSILNHDNASWNWNFGPDATPSSSSQWQEKVVFHSTGEHEVILEIIDNNGFVDRDTLLVEVSGNPSIEQAFEEGFEVGIPTQACRIINHQNNPITWVLNDSVGGFGLSNQCIGIKGFSANLGDRDDIEFDLNLSNIDTPIFSFDVAYARYSTNYTDSLEVLISTDCGVTYQSLYLKGGNELSTAPDTNKPFVPTPNEWRTDSVDLYDYRNFDQLLLILRARQGWGQNMYLDNINLMGDELIPVHLPEISNPTVEIYPNPLKNSQPLFIKKNINSNYNIELFTVKGKLVFSKLNVNSDNISFPYITPGSYFYRISTKSYIKQGVLVVE